MFRVTWNFVDIVGWFGGYDVIISDIRLVIAIEFVLLPKTGLQLAADKSVHESSIVTVFISLVGFVGRNVRCFESASLVSVATFFSFGSEFGLL